MGVTYYKSTLQSAEIDAALHAIDGLIGPQNNGKILYVNNGKLSAKSAAEFEGAVLEPLNVSQNGDYYPGNGVDGFDEVHVNVSGGGGAVVQSLSVTQNGTYNPPSGVDGFSPVTVNVSGGGTGAAVFRQTVYVDSGGGSIDSGDITIQESGQYYVFCGFYTTSTSVTINGVAQALTYTYATDYIQVYDNVLTLNQGDILRLMTSGLGHVALSAFVIKL